MLDSITFKVYGQPMPKGSVVKMGKVYRPAGTPHTRQLMEEWHHNIRVEARLAMGDEPPFDGAVRFMCEFQLPVPSTIRKTQLGWLAHTKRPDADKLVRAMLDALTGIVWVDDSQVAFCMGNKVYAWNGRPGADVIVDFMNDDWLKDFASKRKRIVDVMESL